MFTDRNGTAWRNLKEQVEKNKVDIIKIIEGNITIAEFGIKVINVSLDGTTPIDPPTLEEGDLVTFGYSWLVATGILDAGGSMIYNLYIWTRLEIASDAGWVNVGEFPKRGPIGPTGATGSTGATGAKGDTGERGNKIYFQDNLPISGMINGDLCIMSSFNNYRYNGVQWSLIGNTKGSQGVPGETGANGYTPYIQGGYWFINGVDTGVKAVGQDGTSINLQTGIYTVATLPNFNATNPGDAFAVYEGDPTKDIYDLYFHGFGGVTWSIITDWGGIPGPQGGQGIQGIPGEQGIQGEKGDKGDKGDPSLDGVEMLKDPDKTYLVVRIPTDNDLFTLLTGTTGAPNYTIEWGDGSSDDIVDKSNPTHTYSKAGMYLITISGSFTNGLMLSYGAYDNKMIEVYGGTNYPTSLHEDAFFGCANLTTATFPNATSIGNAAFTSCINLTTATFPKVTSIGYDAFNNCSNLTTPNIPNATSIGYNAFRNCTSLTTANFPNVTSIGGGDFQNCTNLTTANFPKVTTMDNYAFQNCTSLTNLTLGNVTTTGTGTRFTNVKLDRLMISGDITETDATRIKTFFTGNGGTLSNSYEISNTTHL